MHTEQFGSGHCLVASLDVKTGCKTKDPDGSLSTSSQHCEVPVVRYEMRAYQLSLSTFRHLHSSFILRAVSMTLMFIAGLELGLLEGF